MCEAAGNFFRALTSNIKVEEIVIMPGNHDRILLQDAIETVLNSGYKVQNKNGVFPVDGIDVNLDQALFNAEIKHYQNLSLLQLYGIRDKQNQLNIEEKTKVYFANPVYYKKIGGKSFIFNHGIHIYSDFFRLISNSVTLHEIENNTVDSITFIWNNRGDRNLTIQKTIWAGIQFLSAQLLKFRKWPEIKHEPWVLIKIKKIEEIWQQNIFRKIIKDPKLAFFRKLWDIFKKIPGKNILKNNMVFVYGHIHVSEIKEYYVDDEIGTVISFNTGAWSSWRKLVSPDSSILTIDNKEAKLSLECLALLFSFLVLSFSALCPRLKYETFPALQLFFSTLFLFF